MLFLRKLKRYRKCKSYLYYNKLTDLKNINNFKEYDIPSSKSVGYLIDASTGYKYPCIKSITEDLFIIDNEELFIVKQAS